MEKCTLEITDQVNVRFRGLDATTRRKVNEKLKFFVPYARHMPAFKLGRWDGKVSFATVGGATYLNLLDRVLPVVMEAGYEIEIDDRRPEMHFDFPMIDEFLVADTLWPKGHPAEGEPIMLRDYQVEAIQRYLDNPQSIQSISTGAGKTLTTACLSKLVEPYGRSMVIVPSKSLVEQTEEDYKNLGLDVGVFYGDRKEWGRTHTVSTWQSLVALMKRGFVEDDGPNIMELIEGVVCVMVDEVHSAKADKLKELLVGPMAGIPLRWGLTGTVPKDEFEYLSLFAALGPVVGEIRASELQGKGVLASCHVEVVQLQDEHVEFKTYPEEYGYLTTDKTRLNWIARYCDALGKTGNTLILVTNIETGQYLTGMIPGATFVYGDTKSKDRTREYKEVQGATNKVIIATYGVAAVGINIPRIFNLVLFEAGKSFTRVIQSVGRGIRKAQDKESVNIVDLCSTAKFSARHLGKRKAFYEEAEYPFSLTKIDYRD
ncbi:MAG: DEAD/DEAH box helicase [Oxalobacteraceae bacterium]|nr:MAG: DEAD/DEAH box helicase [Oxalobacteraceae bacterium]